VAAGAAFFDQAQQVRAAAALNDACGLRPR
jgi:hypothetical protein